MFFFLKVGRCRCSFFGPFLKQKIHVGIGTYTDITLGSRLPAFHRMVEIPPQDTLYDLITALINSMSMLIIVCSLVV